MTWGIAMQLSSGMGTPAEGYHHCTARASSADLSAIARVELSDPTEWESRVFAGIGSVRGP